MVGIHLQVVDRMTGRPITLPHPREVTVKVDSRRGLAPLDDAPTCLTPEQKQSFASGELLLYRARDGRPVSPMTATASVIAANYAPWHGEVTVAPIPVPDGELQPTIIELAAPSDTRMCVLIAPRSETGSLDGPIPLVVRSGTKIVASYFRAFASSDRVDCRLPVGESSLDLGRAGGVASQRITVERGDDEQIIQLTHQIAAGDIVIAPTDDDGIELQVFTIEKLTVSASETLSFPNSAITITGTGPLKLDNYPPGTYAMIVGAPGRESQRVEIELEPGQERAIRPILPMMRRE
jgi:hypothetical protein